VTVSSGTLDGVTLNCNLDVGNSYNGANLTVFDGLTVNGTVLVGNPANGTWGGLSFANNETFGGNATVTFGNSGCNALRVSTGGDTLTIGPNVIIQGRRAGWLCAVLFRRAGKCFRYQPGDDYGLGDDRDDFNSRGLLFEFGVDQHRQRGEPFNQQFQQRDGVDRGRRGVDHPRGCIYHYGTPERDKFDADA